MSKRRAVILSSVRTGSTWLGETLGQHPAITYDEELLLEGPTVAGNTGPAVKQAYDADEAWNYIHSFVDMATTSWHLWKLQSYQALDPPIMGFTERLAADKKLAVIFLRRENLFHWFTSIKVSEKLKVYTKRVGDDLPEVEPFEIDGDEIEHAMKAELAWWELVHDLFSSRPCYIEASYEMMCHDYEGESARIMREMQLNAVYVQTRSLKMQTRDPKRLVTNYADLCVRFSLTEFAKHGFYG